MPLKKNDLVTLHITGTTHEGLGVGRSDGYVLFVPFTAEGDLAQVRVVKALTHYGYGRLERLLSPSSDRIEVICPVFGLCGGCTYWHISYEAECRIKEQQVRTALQKELGEEPQLLPIVPAPSQTRYRNKVQLPVGLSGGSAVTGFYRGRSHQIIPCSGCLLQPEAADRAARLLCDHIDRFHLSVYDERLHKGLVRSLFVRVGAATGQVMVVIVVNGQFLPHADELIAALRSELPGLVSVQLCINQKQTNVVLGDRYLTLWGTDRLEDRLLGNRYRISAASFYQVNHDQCEALYLEAARLAALTGKERVLDLYCGIGTIGLSMAAQCRELVGVEVVPSAVQDAAVCAREAGFENARFLCADAAQAAAQLAAEGFSPDVVILDPPRKGCDASLLETVAGMDPDRIVYISCNCATLARDARLLRDLGYSLREARPFDLFPRTSHCETAALFLKDQKKSCL